MLCSLHKQTCLLSREYKACKVETMSTIVAGYGSLCSNSSFSVALADWPRCVWNTFVDMLPVVINRSSSHPQLDVALESIMWREF